MEIRKKNTHKLFENASYHNNRYLFELLKSPLYQIAFNIEIYFIETTINNEESILTFQVIFCS